MKNSGNKQPILAICYDFDYTLSPQNMQDGYISSLGADVALSLIHISEPTRRS